MLDQNSARERAARGVGDPEKPRFFGGGEARAARASPLPKKRPRLWSVHERGQQHFAQNELRTANLVLHQPTHAYLCVAPLHHSDLARSLKTVRLTQ